MANLPKGFFGDFLIFVGVSSAIILILLIHSGTGRIKLTNYKSHLKKNNFLQLYILNQQDTRDDRVGLARSTEKYCSVLSMDNVDGRYKKRFYLQKYCK